MDNAALARRCLMAGIDAARPGTVLGDRVQVDDAILRITPVDGDAHTVDLTAHDRVIVVGGGNAAGRVAANLEVLLGDYLDGGVVVTDTPAGTDRIREVRGAHPIPSETGQRGARAVRERAMTAGPDDLVIGVLTGGGSALLPAPAGDLSLADLQTVTERLVTAGVPIEALNAVRKHCSAIKGGRLAQDAAPATTVGIVFSDVIGDPPAIIASGPLSPDPTTYEEALAVLERHGVDAPAVRDHLEAGIAGAHPETPTTVDTTVSIVATNDTAVSAAAEAVREQGATPTVLSTEIAGPAATVGRTHAAIAAECARTGRPTAPPTVLLSGGETTVAATTGGTGGPNQEFVVAAAEALAARDLDASVVVAAADTDGIDGPTEAAGGVLLPDALDPSAAKAALDAHDVTPLLADHDALFAPGPTGTNVNDLRAIVIGD